MKRRQKDNYFKLALLTASIAVAIFLVLSLPVFRIDKFEISGNARFSDDTIINYLTQGERISFFSFNTRRARNELLLNPYIARAQIRKVFPNKLSVNITERRVSGYVQFMNSEFIYIDVEGTVLEVSPNFTERLPVVVGLNFSDFSLGHPILPRNSVAFDIIVELQYLFNKYEMEHDIIRVDLSDEYNILIFIYNIIVEFGCIANADEKMRQLREILPNIPDVETVKGFLNMNSLNRNEIARFRRLT